MSYLECVEEFKQIRMVQLLHDLGLTHSILNLLVLD